MALGKVRSRRDSFGLEVRPDGTLALGLCGDVSHEESEVVRVRSSERGNGSNDRPLLRQANSGSRQGLSSLMKKRRRRDSFGLVVREDGTLSLEQLPRANGSHSPSPSQSGDNVGIQTSRSGRRVLSSQASWDRGDSRYDNWRNSPRRNTSGRRDSFGLEVREDGTLSLERLFTSTSDGGEIEHRHQSRPRPPISSTRQDTPPYEPGSRYGGPSRIMASETAGRSAAGPHSSTSRGVGSQQRYTTNPTSSNRSEVERLRERVRRLEAELASRGRSPTRNSVDAPPAYESRRGSPLRPVESTV